MRGDAAWPQGTPASRLQPRSFRGRRASHCPTGTLARDPHSRLFPPPRKQPATSQALSRLRSEEHTSELQSPCNLVCRLLLEKKNKHTTSRSLHFSIAV